MPRTKIGLRDNRLLTNEEYDLCCRFCDILAAILDQAPVVADGIWWGESATADAFSFVRTKSRFDLDHSFLLNTRFRDFSTIVYDDELITPIPDDDVLCYERLVKVLPRRWQFALPPRFGEIGWNFAGQPVNRHTAVVQERIAGLYLLGVLRFLEQKAAPSILEIGSGGGEMGYFYSRAFPSSIYINCDLTHSLGHGATHLAILCPERRHLVYVDDLLLPPGIDERLIIRSPRAIADLTNATISVPQFLLPKLAPFLHLDLAFNAWSLAEMPENVAMDYASHLVTMLGDRGIFVDQNGDFKYRGGTNTRELLTDFFPVTRATSDLLKAHLFRTGGEVRLWSSGKERLRIRDLSLLQKIRIARALIMNRATARIRSTPEAWDSVAKLISRGLPPHT